MPWNDEKYGTEDGILNPRPPQAERCLKREVRHRQKSDKQVIAISEDRR